MNTTEILINTSWEKVPSPSSFQDATLTFALDWPLRSNTSRCRVGDVAPQNSADPDYFQEFEAPSKPPLIPRWEMGLKVAFYALSFLVTVVGNSLVIFIICRNRKMRCTTNVLLLNLAVSDLMVAAVCMWVHLGNAVTPEWPFGNFVCKVNTFCQVVAVTSSVLSLTVISVERFLAIVFPLRRRWTARVTGVIVSVTWLLSVAVASPHLVVRHTYEQRWKDRQEVWCAEDWPQVYKDELTCDTWEPGKMVYYSIEGIVMYVVPVLIMAAAYSIITYTLITRRLPGTLINSTLSAQERAKRKVIKMLVAVLVCFVVCWTPQQFILLYGVFRPFLGVSVNEASDYHTVKYIALYVAYLNSALNPILYCGFNENFRQSFTELLQCVVIKRNNKVHPYRQTDRQTDRQAAGGDDKHTIDKRDENHHHHHYSNDSSGPSSIRPSVKQQPAGDRQLMSDHSIQITDVDEDDQAEDIFDDDHQRLPTISGCRRRSFQTEDSSATRIAWQAIP